MLQPPRSGIPLPESSHPPRLPLSLRQFVAIYKPDLPKQKTASAVCIYVSFRDYPSKHHLLFLGHRSQNSQQPVARAEPYLVIEVPCGLESRPVNSVKSTIQTWIVRGYQGETGNNNRASNFFLVVSRACRPI